MSTSTPPAAASSSAGIEAGTFATGGEDAAYWANAGFERVVIASDIALLRATLARELSLARSTSEQNLS